MKGSQCRVGILSIIPKPLLRGTIFLLALIIFLHATHLGEFSKTPFLLKHYTEHHERHPQDSFFDFLYKHYIQNQTAESPQDRDSDMRLPFKAHYFHFDLPPFLLNGPIQPVLAVQHLPNIFPNTSTALLFRAYDTWHPPKIA